MVHVSGRALPLSSLRPPHRLGPRPAAVPGAVQRPCVHWYQERSPCGHCAGPVGVVTRNCRMCHDALARCRLVEHRAAEGGGERERERVMTRRRRRRRRGTAERQWEEWRDGKRGKEGKRWRKAKAWRLLMRRLINLTCSLILKNWKPRKDFCSSLLNKTALMFLY